MISDKEGHLVRQFVKAAMEFLSFIDAAVGNLQNNSSNANNNSASSSGTHGLSAGPGVSDETGGHGHRMESKESLLRIQSLLEKRRTANLGSERSPAAAIAHSVEASPSVLPSSSSTSLVQSSTIWPSGKECFVNNDM